MRFVLPLLAAALVATPALAQETRASATAKAAREFALTDANKDGAVTRAEIQARIAAMSAGPRKIDATHAKRLTDLWFGQADANKDGKVTRPEYQTLLLAVFDRYDANGDGKLGGGERGAAKAGVGGAVRGTLGHSVPRPRGPSPPRRRGYPSAAVPLLPRECLSPSRDDGLGWDLARMRHPGLDPGSRYFPAVARQRNPGSRPG